MIRLLRWRKKITPHIDRVEICISGTGGQGIILAGIILAEAAVREGKNALQSQSYGPESRGGSSKCEVIISNREIAYPKTISLDILLVLTDEALQKNYSRLKKDGILIANSVFVKNIPPSLNRKNVYLLALSDIALSLGDIIFTNMVALGALLAIKEVVKLETVKEIIELRVKKKFRDKDCQALVKGYEEAKKILPK